MKKNEINKNYQYYNQQLKELKNKYLEQYVIVSKEKIVFHDKDLQTILEFAKSLDAGSYIIQKVEKNEEKAVQNFHTRVSF